VFFFFFDIQDLFRVYQLFITYTIENCGMDSVNIHPNYSHDQ